MHVRRLRTRDGRVFGVLRTWLRTLLRASALVLAALIAGCGANIGPPPEPTATDEALVIAEALGSLQAEHELEERDEAQEIGAARPSFGLRFEFGRLTLLERMRDRAFDLRFKKTPFDRAVDELPLRKPPLHVRQWVMTDQGPTLDTRADRDRFYRLSEREQSQMLIPKLEHRLYARVDEKQFYAMSERAREAAVKAFYRDAEKVFRKAGFRDFELVVSPLTDNLEQLPELAVGRNGSAALTALGRGRPGPGV